MSSTLDRCRHCGVSIPRGVAIYADRNRKYCSPSCARSQLDVEQGGARREPRAQQTTADEEESAGLQRVQSVTSHGDVPRS